MPGLLAYAMAGAAQGLGDSIVERARQKREEALAAQARAQELADRETGWARDDAIRREENAREDSIRNQGWEREDVFRAEGWEREDQQTAEERDRENAVIDRNMEALRGVFAPTSLERLSGVDPRLAEVLALARQRTGINFQIGEGMRSQAEQEQHVASGASQTRNSYHLHGNAVDVQILNEDGSVNWDFEAYRPLADAAKEIAGELGYDDLVWGGDWESLRDGVHFQMGSSFDAPHGQSGLSDAALAALADPDTPAGVRDAILASPGARGLAPTTQADFSDITWVDNGDGTETRMGFNSVTRRYEPIPGANGQPVTQATTRREAEAVKTLDDLSAQTRYRIETEFEDRGLRDLLGEEVARLVRDGASEEDAYATARAAMTFSREETTDGGWLSEDTTTTVEGDYDPEVLDQSFIGFRYDDEAPPAGAPVQTTATEAVAPAAPAAPAVSSTSRGLAPPPPEPALPDEPPAARLPEGVSKEAALEQARRAIAAGADPEAVIARLESFGLSGDDL
jgi:peptidoglycan L-alanyl-D-glutamate endopeptidase CwlK